MKRQFYALNISLLLLQFSNVFSQAPTKQWDVTFGGSGNDVASSVIQTPDHGYLMGGTSYSGVGGDKTQTSKGGADFWVVKTDSLGQKIWDKVYGGSGDDGLSCLINTSDGGYLLGGATISPVSGDVTQAGHGYNDFWIVKINSNGEKLWDARFGGNLGDDLHSIQQTSDGGFILGGASRSGKNGDLSQVARGLDDYWIVKTNSNGVKQWDARFGGSNEDYFTSLQQTSDGGYILGGFSESDSSFDKSEHDKGTNDYWIVKTDASGIKQWDKTFGGDLYDNMYSIRQTPDGGYLLGGYSNSDSSGDKTQEPWALFQYDYWVVKTDQNGSKLWDKRFGGTEYDYMLTMDIASDGNYLLGGYSGSAISGDKTQASQGSSDYWVLKISTSGVKIWDERFGGSGFEVLYDLKHTPDCGAVLTGYSASNISGDKTQASQGEDDYWTVKLAGDGTSNSIATGTISPTQYIGGDAISVPFIPVGTFIAGNIFTAQLSDQYGNFSAPINIGSLPSTTSGTISGVIPQDLSYGTLYKVRIVSSNPAITGLTPEQSFTIGQSLAPLKEWDVTYGQGLSDVMTGVKQTSDGGYIVGGSTWVNFFNGDWDYQAYKLNADGTSKWKIQLGGLSPDHLTSTIIASDGGFVFAGTSSSAHSFTKSQDTKGFSDYWIYKTDSNGVKKWDKDFGGSSYEICAQIISTSDGGYLVGGTSESGISGDKSQASKGDNDYWIIKTNANGKKKWDVDLGGSGGDQLNSVVQTTDGGYLIGGSSGSGISGDKSQASKGDYDYWIVKTNANGVKQWDKTFGGSDDDELRAVLQTSDGGYLLGGFSYSGIGGDKTQNNWGNNDYWIVKTDANGIKQWDKRYGGLSYDDFTSMAITSDGGYVLAGKSYSGKGGDRTQDSWGLEDYWVVKIDSAGNKVWDVRFGGDDYDRCYTIEQTSDEGFILGGESWTEFANGDKSQDNAGSYSDFWIVKTGPQLSASACDVPAGEYTTNIKSTSAKITWSQVSGAQSYSVRYRLTGTMQWTKVTVTTNSKKLTELAGDSPYDWSVKSICDPSINFSSDWSSIQNFNTKPLRLGNENDDDEISLQVFPNPVSSSATISFSLNEDSKVLIELFSLDGKKVKIIANENFSGGMNRIGFDRGSLSSGVYLLRLMTEDQTLQEKVVIE